jgi:hypothetical protein
LKAVARAARAEVVVAELLDEFDLNVDDAISALDPRFARETLSALTHDLKDAPDRRRACASSCLLCRGAQARRLMRGGPTICRAREAAWVAFIFFFSFIGSAVYLYGGTRDRLVQAEAKRVTAAERI